MSTPREPKRSSPQECDGLPVVAMTGGTGIVGTALIGQIQRELPGHRILALTRRPQDLRRAGVTAAFADVDLPGLGLDDDVRTLLHERATLFIHCAADTRFNRSLAQARLTNTLGTQRAVEVARQCRNLKQFAHISTLYIAGRRRGLVAEEPLRHRDGHVNTYEQAKHEAEDFVLSQSSALPVGIYRLSSVIDESGSGGHFRQVIRFVPWSIQFPFFPADPRVTVDLIGSDWAAEALAVLIARYFTPGCIRHICAGQSESLSVEAITAKVFRAYEGSADATVRRPRFIPLADFHRLCGRVAAAGPSRALESMMTFIPHLSIAQPFDTKVTASLLAHGGVPKPGTHSLLSRVLAEEFRRAEVSL